MTRTGPIDVAFESLLASPATTVWAAASTMQGINAELSPWIKMTVPPEIGSRQLGSWAVDGPGADGSAKRAGSWLLVGGVVPIDRHRFRVEKVIEGPTTWGFDEESTTWLQRRWRHERRVVAVDEATCRVTDHLVVVPRVRFLRAVVAPIVAAAFRHRHRRLVARFTPESDSAEPNERC